MARLQLRVFVRLARWRCGCTPRLIPFFSGAPPSPPNLSLFFFVVFHFFQKIPFLWGGGGEYLRVSLEIYLFIFFLIVSLDEELFKHVFCKSIAPMTIWLFITIFG
jgi:hypothetical protein